MQTRRANTKHWPRKNLGELLNFIEKQHPEGLAIINIAERLDMTQQSVSSMFMKDDIKLSKAENIAEAYGYELKLYFPQRENKLGLMLPPSGLLRQKDFPNIGNLAGLYKYIIDSNMTLNSISQRIGMSFGVMQRAFSKGDIFISTLYEILKELNINVIWAFEENDKRQES